MAKLVQRQRKHLIKLQVYFRRKVDAELARRAAVVLDRPLSAFMREAIIKEARRVIADHENGANGI